MQVKDNQKFQEPSSPLSITSSEAADAIQAYENECDVYKTMSFAELEELRHRIQNWRGEFLLALPLPRSPVRTIEGELHKIEMSLSALNRAWHFKITQTGTRDDPICL
jgi:hypothetical protein